MEVIALCPGGLATGGTEGIHNLVRELNKYIPTKIFYINGGQPPVFKEYHCEFITNFPENFHGAVIFPEVWADQCLDPKYANCLPIVFWQGVDVYNWNVPADQQGKFLERKDIIHLVASEYAKNYLRGLGLPSLKISDCLNEAFFHITPKLTKRNNAILYNPVTVKMTDFQREIMARCKSELNSRFLPLSGYTREQLIDIFQHHKLYIDFGVFSGRERLPREAAMCGCCIVTSDMGASHSYIDMSVPPQYKVFKVEDAVAMIQYILKHYEEVKHDFDEYRLLLRKERYKWFPNQVKVLADEILCHYSSV